MSPGSEKLKEKIDVKQFDEKFRSVLNNQPDNYLLPFLWVHNESDDLILREIEKMYDSGIRALCVESRTHEEFGNDDWWSDLTLILKECEKRGMDVWLLDDKHFPSGFANGKAGDPENVPLRKRIITELHTDVAGPVTDVALSIDTLLPEDAVVKKIVAYERRLDSTELFGECIDFTDRYEKGLCWIDLPEGVWKVFTIYECAAPFDNHVDTTNPEAVKILIDAVYQPMYDHFKDYFGTVFKGYFSDEPYIMHGPMLPEKGEVRFNGTMPYNAYIEKDLFDAFGKEALSYIPALFYNVEGISPKFRMTYMDILSKRYSDSFCWQLGDWSRAHGVAYIGHIIEDNERDTKCASGAHFFRALDGQDMAGIDVVLTEIAPGFQDVSATISHGIHISDHEFFHYELAKLASSHSHIQPLKKGRAMCEMYGAYGWAEGLKMMKWLSDHMLVRGINYFVPHAFSGISPDADCPPHFYEGGTYPQYKGFGQLMEYSNRVSTLLADGVHRCKVALYYRAESEWAGGTVGREKKYAKILTDNQIDFDIIPLDYLLNCDVKDGAICLNEENYPCLVVPYSEYLPIKALKLMKELAKQGAKIVFAGGYPEKSCEGESVSFLAGENCEAIPAEEIANYLRNEGFYDIRLSKPHQNLRYYRYQHGNNDVYFFVNEDASKAFNGTVYLDGFTGGHYIEYDALENRAQKKTATEGISFGLEPYNSLFIILGDTAIDVPTETTYRKVSTSILPDCYDIALAEGAEGYNFTMYKEKSRLFNITSPQGIPDFAGHIRYTTTFDLSETVYDRCLLRMERAGETVSLTVNGQPVGMRIVPPYVFDITEAVKKGENALEIEVTTHMGYRNRDRFSRYLAMEPSGLTGEVCLEFLQKE